MSISDEQGGFAEVVTDCGRNFYRTEWWLPRLSQKNSLSNAMD